MSNYNEWLEEFNRDHEKFKNCRHENPASITDIVEMSKNEMKNYKKFIREFFSKNGSADGIREMYELIDDDSNSWKTIKTCDVNRSAYTYQEYIDGMREYIDDILSGKICSDENQEKLNQAITKCTNQDKIFIHSLFGGDNNPFEDTELSDAVTNIEYLIDFMPKLDEFITVIDKFIYKHSLSSRKVNDFLKINAILLYCDSVSVFCYTMIITIFNDYESINKVLNSNNYNTLKQEFVLF